jgi:hypothetical protein
VEAMAMAVRVREVVHGRVSYSGEVADDGGESGKHRAHDVASDLIRYISRIETLARRGVFSLGSDGFGLGQNKLPNAYSSDRKKRWFGPENWPSKQGPRHLGLCLDWRYFIVCAEYRSTHEKNMSIPNTHEIQSPEYMWRCPRRGASCPQ